MSGGFYMASKGQKFNKYSSEFKENILKEYFSSFISTKCLGEKYGISGKTIDTWLYKTRRNIDIKTDHRPGKSGRTKSTNLTADDYKERYEILKKYQAFLQARRKKR